MLFLAVSTVFLLSAFVKAQSPDCTEGLQRCTNVYMQDVLEHAQSQNVGLICQDLNIFIKCIFDLECGMDEAQKNMVIEKVRSEITAQGFDCDVNLEGVSTHKPRTTIAPEFTTKPKTCVAATQVCTRDYINSAFDMAQESGSDLSWFCPLVNKFVGCLMDSPCKEGEIREAVENKVQSELKQKGIDCEIKYKVASEENSAAKQGTSLILIMATAVFASFKFFF